YLHGHVHSPWCWRLDGEGANVLAVNAGAPIMADADHPAGQGFWEIEFDAHAPHAPHAAHADHARAGGAAADGVDRVKLTHHVPTVDGAWRARVVPVPDAPGQAAQLP